MNLRANSNYACWSLDTDSNKLRLPHMSGQLSLSPNPPKDGLGDSP